ncbi:hypothetical protein LZ30DRAFT_725080 [Colletotrichum cereale]|nr:hypothetical protein LZ30DRAFT_725080 [Colletotrichum cereale]
MGSGIFLLVLAASVIYLFSNTTQATAGHRVTTNVTATADDPDQHDCPLLCVSHTNPDTWTAYQSIERLRRCQKPMLLQLPLAEPLHDTNHTIYCCTIEQSRPAANSVAELNAEDLEYQTSCRKFASSCQSNGSEVPSNVRVALGSAGGWPHAFEAATLLKDLQGFFEDPYNCFQDSFFAQGKDCFSNPQSRHTPKGHRFHVDPDSCRALRW